MSSPPRCQCKGLPKLIHEEHGMMRLRCTGCLVQTSKHSTKDGVVGAWRRMTLQANVDVPMIWWLSREDPERFKEVTDGKL